MDPGLAVALLVFGLPGAVWPYQCARFEERIDAVGSKRSLSDVEPAGWKVRLTRVVSVGMMAVGAVGLFLN